MTTLPTTPRILPPQYFLFSLIGIVLVGIFLPAHPLPVIVRWTGIPLILAGLGIAIAGSRLFARAGTNIIPLTRSSTLVTSGVFRCSRNPMYLGMTAVLGGTALVMQSLWAGPIVVAFFLLIRQQFVLKEEILLTATFGSSYTDWQKRVRRWI
jgi:protein-S-isoprenylcysteine O-methyltransferase Ste14